MVCISEGAHVVGGNVIQDDEEDAYGHKKLDGIGEITGAAIAVSRQHVYLRPPCLT